MTGIWGERLTNLRQVLKRQDLTGLIVPRADEHLGEYVPASAERLAWLTGFTGSAGLAAVLQDKAAIFTDGRYVVQLAAQTDPGLWERLHVTEEPPAGWLAANTPAGAKLGYDPLLISEEGLLRYTDRGLNMVAMDSNPIDAIWTGRPPPPLSPARAHPLEYAGRSAEEKRRQIAALLRDAKQDAAVISDPASIAWLLNIRGGDVPFTPSLSDLPSRMPTAARSCSWIPRSFQKPPAPGSATRSLWQGTPPWHRRSSALAASGFALTPRAVRSGSLKRCGKRGRQWSQDPIHACCRRRARTRSSSKARVTLIGVMRLRCADSCTSSRRRARGAARPKCRRQPSCWPCANRLAGFRGESFPAISGAGEHGAIIHYRVTEESNRPNPAERGLPDRFRCAVSRRHDRHHPHDLDRARRCRRKNCANA